MDELITPASPKPAQRLYQTPGISSSQESNIQGHPDQSRPAVPAPSSLFPIPFVGGSTATPAGGTVQPSERVSSPSVDQMEMKLQSRLAEICILLATKLRDAPIKVLQLRRSQLAIASWEVDALLSSEEEPISSGPNKQNYFIRRSISLLAEMQEVGISCRELLTAGKREEAYIALATAEYFLEQARTVISELETLSHRERDCGEYAIAQNLAATRQKLVSTQQLLTTLINWLKREMEK
jgi:hypothetical protein